MRQLYIFTTVFFFTSAILSAQTFTQEELEDALVHGEELTTEAQRGLDDAITRDALIRNNADATVICYDGTNPSNSGLGRTLEEAQADARVRRTINACLRFEVYRSTNDCRKTMGLNLPPNTHPKKTIEALLANDANVYPLMKKNGTLQRCLGDQSEGQDPRVNLYRQIYIGHMTGSPELPKCGPIGKNYKWIKNASGQPQLFRGDRGYIWGHVYDDGVNAICGQ